MNGYDELCEISKLAYAKGLEPGGSGNASIRKSSFIAITQSGMSLNDTAPENIVEIDFEGNSLNGKKASTEKFMHIEIYKNRSDINAILHAHSTFLSTFALKGIPIENSPIVELKYLFNDKVPLVPYFAPGSAELAQAVGESFKNYDAVIMQNHGAIVGAKTIKEAFYKYEVLEYMARVIIQEKLLQGCKF